MALGNTNISVGLVQSTIGVSSTSSVGGLIAKAASGDIGGYAFYINETYGTTGKRDGTLIQGAKPHWNMWSKHIPAEWWVNNSGVLELRLKRNANNSNGGYDFRLHDFRLYDHSAIAPQLSVPSTVNAIAQNVQVDFLVNMHQMALPSEITHIKVVGQIGIQTSSVLIPLSDINDDTELISAYYMTFSSVTESSGTVTVYGSNSIGQEIASMGNVFSVRNFNINYLSQYATLSRIVGVPETVNYSILGSIIVPSGSGNIQLPAGGTQLTGITIRFTGISSVYSVVYFDLYLQQTSESNVYVGSYYSLLSSSGDITDVIPDTITYADTLATGDNLGFIITNLSV